MKLSLGFSPCPNDTFIFEALVHGRVDTEGVSFDWFLADVEELNRRAMEGSVDVTKMSFHAYAMAAANYL
ncbi:MAG TPA: MqnA/MqnD/SBP family protein, partial [Bacteroidales bacterium]|nr:MqnA/MqnD/SBP family protein [Bacteroidales bacterium]